MTESYYMRRASLQDRLACRAVARLCSICKTYVQKVEETWALTTEVEHPRVFIDTYSSAYWQLPLRMYRHIRRLYDPPVHTAIYWIEMYMMKENGAAAKSGLLKKTRRLHENRDPGTVFTLPHFAKLNSLTQNSLCLEFIFHFFHFQFSNTRV